MFWTKNTFDFWQKLTWLLLAVVFIVILVTFRDYGLTYDEELQKGYGEAVIKWYSTWFADRSALSFGGNVYAYGGFFEVFAQLLTRISPLGLYETRHLAGALFGFFGFIAAYLLGEQIAGSRAGFFSVLLLVLNPIYYGNMFNNSKDLPFAVPFAFAIYFMMVIYKSLPEIKTKHIICLGVFTGLALGIRIGGVLLFGYAFLILAYWFVLNKTWQSGEWRKLVSLLVIVIAISWITMLLFWPWAQISPFINPNRALRAMTHFNTPINVYFQGFKTDSLHLPWQYLPVSFAMQLPDSYILCIAIGLALCLLTLKEKHKNTFNFSKNEFLSVMLLIAAIIFPVMIVLVKSSAVYNGIRHFIFILPQLAVLSGVCLSTFLDHYLGKRFRPAIVLLFVATTGGTLSDMIEVHPYQSIYYNHIVAGGLETASKENDTDYWGSSYKEGIEWVVNNYRSSDGKPVVIANCSTAFLTGYFIDKNDAKNVKFKMVSPGEKPGLLLGLTYAPCYEDYVGKIIYSVKRKNVPFLHVYELSRK